MASGIKSDALRCAEVALAFRTDDDARVLWLTDALTTSDEASLVLLTYRARSLQRTNQLEPALHILGDVVKTARRKPRPATCGRARPCSPVASHRRSTSTPSRPSKATSSTSATCSSSSRVRRLPSAGISRVKPATPSGSGTRPAAPSAARPSTFSTTTSSRSRWAAPRMSRTSNCCAARAIGVRPPRSADGPREIVGQCPGYADASSGRRSSDHHRHYYFGQRQRGSSPTRYCRAAP